MSNDKKNTRTSKSKGVHHANNKDQKVFLKRLRSAFRKISVELKLENTNEIIPTTLVLTEIDGKSAFLLSPKKIKKNSTLLFNIRQPLSFEIRAIVRYCEALEGVTSNFQLGNDKGFYRTYIEFIFSTELEKQAMMDIYYKVRDENHVPTQWHIFITEQIQHKNYNVSPEQTLLFSNNYNKTENGEKKYPDIIGKRKKKAA